jgi:hypothetical protein
MVAALINDCPDKPKKKEGAGANGGRAAADGKLAGNKDGKQMRKIHWYAR